MAITSDVATTSDVPTTSDGAAEQHANSAKEDIAQESAPIAAPLVEVPEVPKGNRKNLNAVRKVNRKKR